MLSLRDIALIVLVTMIGAMGCRGPHFDSQNCQPGDVTGDQISQLRIGEGAEFCAVIGKLSANNCIEIFIPGEYERYKGDVKWAIPSRLASSVSASGLSEGKRGIVAGTMIRIKDSEDLLKTCGIVTGDLFEVGAIR